MKKTKLLRQLLTLSIVIAMMFAILPFGTRSNVLEYEPECPPCYDEVIADDETEEVEEAEAEAEEPEETQPTDPEVDIPVLEETEEIATDEEEIIIATEHNSFETMAWNEGYTAPGVGVVATMAVRADAPAFDGQWMDFWSRPSEWRNPLINDGEWQSGGLQSYHFDIIRADTDPANRIIHIFTPMTSWGPHPGGVCNMSAILPNIRADVTIDMCPSITDAGDWFMAAYAQRASQLTSIVAPDTSNLTSVGDTFMIQFAMDAYSLTTLGAPDISNVTNVGDFFMSGFALRTTSLTSLCMPDTSSLISVGHGFMSHYAYGTTSLISLGVPDTSNVTSVGDVFMGGFVRGATSLRSLGLPDTSNISSAGNQFMVDYAHGAYNLDMLIASSSPGWFVENDIFWNIPEFRDEFYCCCHAGMPSDGREPMLGHLQITVLAEYQTAWKALTVGEIGFDGGDICCCVVDGRTLFLNWIRSTDDIISNEPEPTPTPEITPTPDNGYGGGGMNGNGEEEDIISDNGTGSPLTGDFSALMLGASSLMALAGVGSAVKRKKGK